MISKNERSKYEVRDPKTSQLLGEYDTREQAEAQERALARKDEAPTVRRFEHLDFKASELAKPEVTQDGFWRLEGKVARTGVQHYTDGAGGTRREMRREDQVKKSVAGFAQKPLTNGHPSQLVNPDNAKQHVAGAVGEATYADGWVKAPITVWTKDAIEAVRSGKAQLSVGYTCRLVQEDGVHNGEAFDCVQEDIVVNHVALVDAARAGPEARLRLDATDAITTDFGHAAEPRVSSPSTTPQPTETTRMLKMKLDGYEFEVADSNAQTAIEKSIAAARKDGESAAAAHKDRADKADKELADLKAEKSALQGKHDALESASKADVKCDECSGSGKVDEKACDGCAGKGQMKADALTFEWRKASRDRSEQRAVASRVDARAALLTQVAPHLSKNTKLDGLSDLAIKKLVLAEHEKDLKLDGKDESYVTAYFDAVIGRLAKTQLTPLERVRLVQDGAAPPIVDDRSDADDPKDKQSKAYDEDYFKKKKTADKK